MAQVILFIFRTTSEPTVNKVAVNVLDKLKRYNLSLENTSAVFMQSNGKTIEEGIIYFGGLIMYWDLRIKYYMTW